MHQVAVQAQAPEYQHRARLLAEQLQMPLLEPGGSPQHCSQARLLLRVGSDCLALQQAGPGAPGPVVVDFGDPALRHRRRGGHNELLGRAVGVGRREALRVLDATAGLGRDGFVLADLGCSVLLCERHPVIASLLRSGIEAARASDDAWLARAAARLELRGIDARQLQAGELRNVDVIYLDPMFPARRKRAAVKKEMALFQLLLDPVAAEAEELLAWALAQAVARVVVKRPAPGRAAGGPGACAQHWRQECALRRARVAGGWGRDP